MYYFVTASKDSTIYLQQPSQNTGRDEIRAYIGDINLQYMEYQDLISED